MRRTLTNPAWNRLVKRLIAPLAVVAIVVAVLVATAGGGGATGDSAAPVPRLNVPRLDGGGDFALTRLASSESPTLLWFWAPWCEICNQEAANIERLAVEARNDLTVVAIGGRDDAANGPAFVARHGLRTPTVLFDESMAAWEAYRIPGQPGAVLLDRDGRERARWSGPFDTSAALDEARAL
jgi:thiol-disulfide isomerase/thioredoxin